MGPSCPKCSTALKDDYGMVTCPGCGSIVFVDMDGNAQVATEVPAEETPIVPLAPPKPSFLEEIPMEAEGTFPPIEVTPEPFAEPGTDSEMDMNAFLGYEPDSDAVAAAAARADAAAASQNDPNDPLGLSAYANSEVSNAQNGPLVVTLIISGIDAKDLRDEIRQALQDSRFGWDTAALMSSIKGGILRIEQVSPVKATIVINRIKNLSVRIRWEQNAITEIDLPGKEP